MFLRRLLRTSQYFDLNWGLGSTQPWACWLFPSPRFAALVVDCFSLSFCGGQTIQHLIAVFLAIGTEQQFAFETPRAASFPTLLEPARAEIKLICDMMRRWKAKRFASQRGKLNPWADKIFIQVLELHKWELYLLSSVVIAITHKKVCWQKGRAEWP